MHLMMGQVRIVDLAQGEIIPYFVVESLFDPADIKTAYNANFERTCLAKHFGQTMPADQWQCTMVQALTLGTAYVISGCRQGPKTPTG